jgi:hypothetical protein
MTQVSDFVDHYSNHRYDESLGTLPPADVYFGRSKAHRRGKREDQETDHPNPPLEPSRPSGII